MDLEDLTALDWTAVSRTHKILKKYFYIKRKSGCLVSFNIIISLSNITSGIFFLCSALQNSSQKINSLKFSVSHSRSNIHHSLQVRYFKKIELKKNMSTGVLVHFLSKYFVSNVKRRKANQTIF